MKVALRLLLLVVVLVVLAAGWIAWTGDRARTDLLVARDEVDVMLGAARSGDDEGARAALARVQERTGAAAARTSDPVWDAAAFAPVVGDDVDAVSTLSGEMHALSTDVLGPLVDVAGTVELSSGAPRVADPAAVAAAADRVEQASAALDASRARVEQVPADGLVGPVADARSRALEAIAQADSVLEPLAALAGMVP